MTVLLNMMALILDRMTVGANHGHNSMLLFSQVHQMHASILFPYPTLISFSSSLAHFCQHKVLVRGDDGGTYWVGTLCRSLAVLAEFHIDFYSNRVDQVI
jgi:hypothetical protein